MAPSLISLLTLATIITAAPLAVVEEVDAVIGAVTTTAAVSCAYTYWSVAEDNCDIIAAKVGLTAVDILDANSFLNCADIWVNTPICISYPRPITYITAATSTPNCLYTYISVATDTCDSIGLANEVSGQAIHDANTFLDCNNIWIGTPVCIPSTLMQATTTRPGVVVLTEPPVFSAQTRPTASINGGVTIFVTPTQTCGHTYISVAEDTCDSIGASNNQSGDIIFAYNTFLDCNNIWVGTPICIPAIWQPYRTTLQRTTATPTPTSTPTTLNCLYTYQSGDGDTCDSIGQITGLSPEVIHAANDFLDCNNIWVNTVLCIPPAPYTPLDPSTLPPRCLETYTSVEGDTCDSIGRKYNIASSLIFIANDFLTCDNIWAYTPICIPAWVEPIQFGP